MTKQELKTLNQELKKVPTEKRPIVRRMLSADIPLSDALTVVRAFIPSTSQNKTISDVQGENTPLEAETGKNNPVTTSNGENIPANDPQQEEKLERVSDAGQLNITEIQDKIQSLIDNYIEINDIQDMSKEPQRKFTAMSMYIGKHLFKGTRILKAVNGKHNEYDITKIVQVLEYYVFLCNYYNKAFTLDGGAYFCGLSNNYLTENKEKLTLASFDPNKKSEETIAASILDNKQCVGSIAYLNHVFNWQTNHTHTEKKETVIIYPSLSSDLSQKTPLIATDETKQVL